jgi:hypothetical protein
VPVELFETFSDSEHYQIHESFFAQINSAKLSKVFLLTGKNKIFCRPDISQAPETSPRPYLCTSLYIPVLAKIPNKSV